MFQICLKYSEMTLFADDMALYCPSIQLSLTYRLNSTKICIKSLNKLIISIEKSKFMLIGNKRRLQNFNGGTLIINDDLLGRVTEFKYLGVILEETLSW